MAWQDPFGESSLSRSPRDNQAGATANPYRMRGAHRPAASSEVNDDEHQRVAAQPSVIQTGFIRL